MQSSKEGQDPSNMETQLLQTPGADATAEKKEQDCEDGEEENQTDDAAIDDEWDMDPEMFRSSCQPHQLICVDVDSASEAPEDEPPPKKQKNTDPENKKQKAEASSKDGTSRRNLEEELNKAEVCKEETDAQQELSSVSGMIYDLGPRTNPSSVALTQDQKGLCLKRAVKHIPQALEDAAEEIATSLKDDEESEEALLEALVPRY